MPVLLLVLGACTETRYVAYGEAPRDGDALIRLVEYRITDALYETAPSCTVILPLRQDGGPGGDGVDAAQAVRIEESLARHFHGRLDRVVGPAERDSALRSLALDPADARDRAALADGLRCETVVEAEPVGIGDIYALFWAGRQFGLDLRLARARDDATLWQARHIAQRGDGGLPLSLIGLPLAAAMAGRFAADGDALPSMVDDTLRRMTATLPDLRMRGRQGWRRTLSGCRRRTYNPARTRRAGMRSRVFEGDRCDG